MAEPIEAKLSAERVREAFGETVQLPEEIAAFLDKVEVFWQAQGREDFEEMEHSTSASIPGEYMAVMEEWKELRQDLGYPLTDDEVYPLIEEQLGDLGEIEEGETALLILPAQVSQEQQDRVTAQIYSDYEAVNFPASATPLHGESDISGDRAAVAQEKEQ